MILSLTPYPSQRTARNRENEQDQVQVKEWLSNTIPGTFHPLTKILYRIMTEQEVSPEEVAMGQKITDLGNQIKEAKTAGKSKDEWDPLLQEMLATKVRFVALHYVAL